MAIELRNGLYRVEGSQLVVGTHDRLDLVHEHSVKAPAMEIGSDRSSFDIADVWHVGAVAEYSWNNRSVCQHRVAVIVDKSMSTAEAVAPPVVTKLCPEGVFDQLLGSA